MRAIKIDNSVIPIEKIDRFVENVQDGTTSLICSDGHQVTVAVPLKEMLIAAGIDEVLTLCSLNLQN